MKPSAASAGEASRVQAESLEEGEADGLLNLELVDVDGELASIAGGPWQLCRFLEGTPAQPDRPLKSS